MAELVPKTARDIERAGIGLKRKISQMPMIANQKALALPEVVKLLLVEQPHIQKLETPTVNSPGRVL